jgi:hypothetical protein
VNLFYFFVFFHLSYLNPSQSDVWAFGIMFWEMVMMGGIPYPGVPARKMFQLLTVDKYRMPKVR